jgi:hypothetical protein
MQDEASSTFLIEQFYDFMIFYGPRVAGSSAAAEQQDDVLKGNRGG